MKTKTKQDSLPAVRKEKEKKKELLSGWKQEEETLLQDDIGIETWFDDECSSDDDNDIKDRRYKCALMQSLEKRKRIHTSKSATRQNQNRQAECCKSSTVEEEGSQESLTPVLLMNREPTLSSKSSASLTVLSEKSTDSISSSNGQVTLNQSTSADDTRCDNRCDFQNWAPQKLTTFSNSNNSPIVTLLRYEERLKTRRENKLNKRFGDIFGKVEKSDTISPKTPVSMTRVCFTQGMIQPISKTTKNLRYNPRAKLPSLETNNKNNAQNSKVTSKLTTEEKNKPVKGAFAEACRDSKAQTKAAMKDRTSKKEVSDTKVTISESKSTTMIVNKRKFNFDVLENYARVRNSRKDTNFTEYVKMIRKFQNLPLKSSDKQLSTEEGKALDLRMTNSSDNLSFDTVRALWHEAQKNRLATRALSERLSSNAKRLGAILMLDVDPRSRSSSEPIGKAASSNNGRIHKGKYTCPLQRILAVTSKRMQANEEVFLKISQDEQTAENKRVGITRSKTGIQCYIVGRNTPAAEDTAVER